MPVKRTFIVLLFLVTALSAQDKKLNEFGLYVVSSFEEYSSLCRDDSSKILVDIREIIPGLKTDVLYATENNFLKKKVYPSTDLFLRLPAALALKEVQTELKNRGMELKIYDAYRPYSVTVKMFEFYPDTNYVASPISGSRHNRGCAVDLTIIESETGEEIRMPTEYDDFSEKAHPDYMNLPEEVRKNRQFLIELMKKQGFTVMPTEWWHFDFKGWGNYELLDLPFEKLK